MSFGLTSQVVSSDATTQYQLRRREGSVQNHSEITVRPYVCPPSNCVWGIGNWIGISGYYILAKHYLDLSIFDNFLEILLQVTLQTS